MKDNDIFIVLSSYGLSSNEKENNLKKLNGLITNDIIFVHKLLNSTIETLISQKDYSSIERLLLILIENDLCFNELNIIFQNWSNGEDGNLIDFSKKYKPKLSETVVEDNLDFQSEEKQNTISNEEEKLFKFLLEMKDENNHNEYFLCRVIPQDAKIKLNYAIINSNDIILKDKLVQNNFKIYFNYSQALADIINKFDINFAFVDLNIESEPKAQYSEAVKKDELVNVLLSKHVNCLYIDVQATYSGNYTFYIINGKKYYVKFIKVLQDRNIIGKIISDILKPTFEDNSLSIIDKSIIMQFITPNIKNVKYSVIKTGFSGSRNYLIDLVNSNNEIINKYIVKINTVEKTLKEEINFKNIIKDTIQVPLHVNKKLYEDVNIGALFYEYAIGAKDISTESLKKISLKNDKEVLNYFLKLEDDYSRNLDLDDIKKKLPELKTKDYFNYNDKSCYFNKLTFLSRQIDDIFENVMSKFKNNISTSSCNINRLFGDYVKTDEIILNLQNIIPNKYLNDKYKLYDIEYNNPYNIWNMIKNNFNDFPVMNVHGDLHTDNIMIDQDGKIFLIDYGKSQKDGFVFIDYAMLEVSIKFDLIFRSTPYTELVKFEEHLCELSNLNEDKIFVTDYEFIKECYLLIKEIRKQAFNLYNTKKEAFNNFDPQKLYFLSLFCLSFAQIAYCDMNQQYALLSSSILSKHIDIFIEK